MKLYDARDLNIRQIDLHQVRFMTPRPIQRFHLSVDQFTFRLTPTSILVLASAAVCHAAGTPQIERGIVYGEANNERLLVDVYLPSDSSSERRQPRMAVLLVHSGGWCSGGREAPIMATMGNALAGTGYVAFSIDYRLVKNAANGQGIENQYPAAIEDCWQALRWIHSQAEKYQLDPARTGAFGDSAGGHLVSLLGTADPPLDDQRTTDRLTRVRAVVTFYGPSDLTKDFSHCRYPDGSSVQDLIDRFLGVGRDRPVAKKASPVFHVDDRTAAFLIVHGADDRFVPVQQSRDFHAALEKAGRRSKYIEIKGGGHGFVPEVQQRLVSDSITFFDQNLKQVVLAEKAEEE